MAPQVRNQPISAWKAGDSVTGFALLSRYERRQDKNGNDFLDLILADRSGSLSAKVWSDSPALDGDFAAHDFVAFKGSVKSYRDAIQVSISECRRATEADRQFGFDEGLLIPTTREDIGELWKRLRAIYPDRIQGPMLRRLARESMSIHGEALKEHPAAKSIHHAYRGGLLEHVVSMAELAEAVCAHYGELDADLVLLGVLFHDLGKLVEIGQMPANDYTTEGQLVGHVVIGRDLLREACARIEGFPTETALHLEHLVLSHQGLLEYGSPVRPMTAEAMVLHFIDNLDSKLAQVRGARESGHGFRYIRGLGRYVYLGPDESEADEEEPAAESAQASLKL